MTDFVEDREQPTKSDAAATTSSSSSVTASASLKAIETDLGSGLLVVYSDSESDSESDRADEHSKSPSIADKSASIRHSDKRAAKRKSTEDLDAISDEDSATEKPPSKRRKFNLGTQKSKAFLRSGDGTAVDFLTKPKESVILDSTDSTTVASTKVESAAAREAVAQREEAKSRDAIAQLLKSASKSKPKARVKERERLKRQKGQSSQSGWKPEIFMQLRQQFD